MTREKYLARMEEIKAREERATPGPCVVERIDHDSGDTAYEINDDHHLVAFYETNHTSPMKAKFNAELYAHSRTDLPVLREALEFAVGAIDKFMPEDACTLTLERIYKLVGGQE